MTENEREVNNLVRRITDSTKLIIVNEIAPIKTAVTEIQQQIKVINERGCEKGEEMNKDVQERIRDDVGDLHKRLDGQKTVTTIVGAISGLITSGFVAMGMLLGKD